MSAGRMNGKFLAVLPGDVGDLRVALGEEGGGTVAHGLEVMASVDWGMIVSRSGLAD